MPPGPHPRRTLLADLGQALGFCALSLVLGLIRFQIPGVSGVSADLREIGLIVAAFHLHRGWLLVFVGASASLDVPAGGSALGTLLPHVVIGPLAWWVARELRSRIAHPALLGGAWVAFVALVYYALTCLPLLLIGYAALGLMAWSEVIPKYPSVLRDLLYEVATTAGVTSLYLVNLRQLDLLRGSQRRLAESEARLAGILAAAPVGIAVVREGRLAWVNEKLALLAGRPAQDLLDLPLEGLLAGRTGSILGLPGLVRLAEAQSEGAGGEFDLRVEEGEPVAVLVHASAMPEEEHPAYTLSILDVTERIRLEQQLRKTQRLEALGQVSGSVAHDFGNLLQALELSILDMEEGLAAGEAPEPGLAQMKGAIAQGRRVIQQLLAFSRRQPRAPDALDLGQLLRQSAPMLQTMVGREIRLTVEAPEGLPAIHADPGQVEQVVLNLVINARDAIQARGDGPRTLGVAALPSDPRRGEPEDRVVLEVADTGSGMDEATRARIFEPFFTTKPEGKGSGLGLATVYGIVQSHGGSLALTSQLGVGTTFRIAWPLHGEGEGDAVA